MCHGAPALFKKKKCLGGWVVQSVSHSMQKMSSRTLAKSKTIEIDERLSEIGDFDQGVVS